VCGSLALGAETDYASALEVDDVSARRGCQVVPGCVRSLRYLTLELEFAQFWYLPESGLFSA
jgi:hypothetical protein